MTDLSIKNFQSISNINFKINGFTVVVGPSDIGKSAIRRAINFPLTNDWDKAYLRNDSKDVEIEISKDDFNLKRIKGKSNITVLNGTTFEKSGTTTPQEFQEFGIKQLKTVDNEYNIIVSSQLDRLFLTSFSETEQHKVLNAVLETAKYEEALRFVNADINNLSKQSRETQDEIDKSLLEIARIESVLEALARLENLQEQVGLINKFSDTQSNHADITARKVYMDHVFDKISKLILVQQYSTKESTFSRAVTKHTITRMAVKNHQVMILLLEFSNANRNYLSSSRKFNLLSDVNTSLSAEIASSYQSFITQTSSKLAKGLKISKSMDMLFDLYNQAQTLSSWVNWDSKSNDVICRSMALSHNLKSTENQEAILKFLRLYQIMDTTKVEIDGYNGQISSLDEEIRLALAEHAKTCKTCETCGQPLPK